MKRDGTAVRYMKYDAKTSNTDRVGVALVLVDHADLSGPAVVLGIVCHLLDRPQHVFHQLDQPALIVACKCQVIVRL